MGQGVIEIRKMQPKDVYGCASLMADIYGDGSVDNIFPSVDKNEAMAGLLRINNEGAIWVADSDSITVGVMILEKANFFWNANDLTLSNTVLIVADGYRDKKIAETFIEKAQAFAKECGAKLIIGVQSHKQVAAKERFMRMRSVCYIGSSYLCTPHDE